MTQAWNSLNFDLSGHLQKPWKWMPWRWFRDTWGASAGRCSISLPVEVRYIQSKWENVLLESLMEILEHFNQQMITWSHIFFLICVPVRHRYCLKKLVLVQEKPGMELWCSVKDRETWAAAGIKHQRPLLNNRPLWNPEASLSWWMRSSNFNLNF